MVEQSSVSGQAKAAIVGVATLSSMLLSYFIYKKVIKEPSEAQIRRSKRELRKALRQARASKDSNQERIVGANMALRTLSLNQDEREVLERLQRQNKMLKIDTLVSDDVAGLQTPAS